MIGRVYIITNNINNKVYIGQTGQNVYKRWQNGKHYESCPYFNRAIQRYGWNNFDHIIWATGLTLEEANHLEELLIKLFDTTNPDIGYNIRSGGNNSQQSEESIKKRCKAVYCVELNKSFDSIKLASLTTGTSASHIGECCKNKRKSAGGYHWHYLEVR